MFNQFLRACNGKIASRFSRYLSSERISRLRRAVLYIPGNDEKKIQKADNLNSDCIILDCEDGVALNRKVEARQMIRKLLDSNHSFGRSEFSVRVNAVGNELAREDLEVILKSKYLPTTILFPKVDKVEDMDWIVSQLDSIVASKKLSKRLCLIIYTESALGLLSLVDICKKAARSCVDKPFILDGIVFGSDDFCANIGATRTESATELLYARQHLVTVAKAFGLQAIDMVHIDYKDMIGLKENAEAGAKMGFTGKQIIHPGQIDIVQKAFSPSKDKIKWAQELIKAFQEHQKSGEGAFTFQDQMIDMPTVLQAKNIISLAVSAKLIN